MKETEVLRTETNAPGVHAVREVQTTTTNTNTNARQSSQTLPGIVGAGVKTRGYGRDHIVTKQQVTYMAPIALAILLALTLLYLRSHEMFPWHHTPTLQEKVTNQYADLSNKATQSARDAAKMATDAMAGGKAANLAKEGAEWLAKQGINEKLNDYAGAMKENLGEYTDTIKDTLHVGRDRAAERAREAAEAAADRGYATRAKDWVGDKVNEATSNIGNKVGSVTEDIKHRVEELREDARHAAEVAKEEARHAAAQKSYEAGSTYNDAKVKAHDTKRSLKDAAAQKIAEHL